MNEIKKFVMNIENNEKLNLKKYDVRISEKLLLTLEEAAAYTGIGINKLRMLSESENCPYVLWNGSRRLLKREKLSEFLMKQYSI